MSEHKPLAHRVRPRTVDEFVGQQHLLTQGRNLHTVFNGGQLHSMIFWGPPGTGKTTLATMLAHSHDSFFANLSAVSAGVKDIRAVVAAAQQRLESEGTQTILFLDEVHRFNKSQQDAFLPYIEDGTIVFVGATTENPAFALNNALLSRARVYVLKSLTDKELQLVLENAIAKETPDLEIEAEHLHTLASAADGDARKALGMLELLAAAVQSGQKISTAVDAAISGQTRRFDKSGDDFFDQISALHKSVRGSDPDAALYWLARMLDGGCDPRYILRRVIRMASEDIGNADPRALWIALDCNAAFERLGTPEGDLAIAQAVVYLSCAPKSNAIYMAFKKAQGEVAAGGSLPVPDHLRNAPTRLAKSMGHGKDYQYAHDFEGGFVAGEDYFPQGMQASEYYQPVPRGLEIKISERLATLRKANHSARKKKHAD